MPNRIGNVPILEERDINLLKGEWIMATERQIVANRENAKKSTGPRTAEGKEVSSGNAIKHGLTAAKRVVIRDESAEQFERMHQALLSESVTGSELERGLIEEIAAAMWRLRRAARIERDMMDEDLRKALERERINRRRTSGARPT